MKRFGVALAVAMILASQSVGAEAPRFVPFVLPWDDASPGVTNVSAWLHKPAGKFGHVHAGNDGHLYAGDERVRFFGVNLCFSATMPRHEDADKIAGRMAKFGVNVVRFHHMDMFTFPSGIRARKSTHTSDLDPEALDRLDYLIAQLKKHGIYSNLNLLVSRPFGRADGLPTEIERVDVKERHVIGFFHEPILRLQQEYARNLLTHRNAYTQVAYAEDPAVAFVEINNENGLLQGWLGNQIDRLPDVFLQDLRRQWNAWLRKRYQTTGRLYQAWGIKAGAAGAELLANNVFSQGTEHWSLERHGDVKASVMQSTDLPEELLPAANKSAQIAVTKRGSAAWHAQFLQAGLKVQVNQPYTLTFWAKGDRSLSVTAQLGQAHAPWKELGFDSNVRLTTQWKSYRFVFPAGATDDNARLNFTNLAQQEATVWLAGLSLRPGGVVGLGENEKLETNSIPAFTHSGFGERAAAAQRDWLRFLWETEDAYWQTMQRYLKDELRVRGVVIGTIVGCSTPNLMARLDAVDTHAYWQHPQFPSKQWDASNWVVGNRSMVNQAGGTLPGLAQRRVLGKPHCVTEYNHPAPNRFASEGFLLLAAYGALQDWDAIYAFAYAQGTDWSAGKIQGFFEIDQHPTKMATLPAAAALFLRGDVKPAVKQVIVALNKEREIELLRTAYAWDLVHAGQLGVPRETALVHRVGIATEGMMPAQKPSRFDVAPADALYPADTGELLWDLRDRKHGVVTINTPKSKGVIGYGGGKRYDLGGFIIEPGVTAQDGWSTITVTAMEGKLDARPARLLITATGSAENTGMQWKNAIHDSVGRHWGSTPSLVEVVPAGITLPIPAARVRAWTLDARGQRQTPLKLADNSAGKATLLLETSGQTLWYEIELL